MIPPDVASRLQANADAALRPVAPTQEITDKLSGLVAGQRIMAEIQALLPNGTYRALINQRNITLALPFSAKSGDSLELQVTESDGKVALAVVSHQQGDQKPTKEAVTATLSRTGQLISNLFADANETDANAKALPLNGNKPVSGAPPGSAQDILPLLKEAITKSGMFYESHQAEWIEGRLAKAALLQEPQGKLSAASAFATPSDSLSSPAAQTRAAPEQSRLAPFSTPSPPGSDQSSLAKSPQETTQMQSSSQIVAPQAQPIVQHQLEALANQTFVWQGQIWPGQEMRWEIEENSRKTQEEDDPGTETWRTTLDLRFPALGGISAKLHLVNDQINLAIILDKESAVPTVQDGTEALRQQLYEAGLILATVGVTAETPDETP